MKRWYCVIETYDDYGRVTANLVDVAETDEKPVDTAESTDTKDIYCTWYGSEQEANRAIKDALMA